MKFITLVSTLLFLVISIAKATGTSEQGWKIEEVNESNMRSLTKDECVKKTIALIGYECSSQKCLRNNTIITNQCIPIAKGNTSSFCKAYSDNYIKKYCDSKILNAKSCEVLYEVQTAQCKN